MEDEKQVEQDRQRAEIFDALGHPSRILILKVLNDGSLGFADLKKKTGFESSGHLQHHLTKLDGLIRTDEYGKYCLSDEGKEALLTVQTVENSSPRTVTKEEGNTHFKVGLKPVAILLVALLVASSAVAVYEYNQAVGSNKENNFFKGLNTEATAYYNKFGAVVPLTHTNSSFAPPISMYQALLIGLNNTYLNKITLRGMTVSVNIEYRITLTNVSALNSIIPLGIQSPYATHLPVTYTVNLTSPPLNYSDVSAKGVFYQYVWQINISDGQTVGGFQVSVDASTGQLAF